MNKKTTTNPEESIKLSGRYFEGVGRRKRAIARVRLYKGTGAVYLNDKQAEQIDPFCLQPLIIVNKQKDFDCSIQVKGGGVRSQLGAICLGISRALVKFDESLRPSLRKLGYLTRDPREKERKKPGLKRARRAPQWQKR